MASKDPRDTLLVEPKSGAPEREQMMFKMSAEEAYELQRMRVISSVQGDLLAWGKKRFWAVTVIVALIGFIGVPALVRDIARGELDEVRRKSAEAEAAAAVAQQALAKAQQDARAATLLAEGFKAKYDEMQESTQVAQARVDDFSDRLSTIRTDADELMAALESLAADIEARSSGVREEAALEIDVLRGQIGLLSDQVSTLTRTAISSQEAEDFKARKDDYSREQMMRKQDFYANRSYRVLVVPYISGEGVSGELTAVLQKSGYEAARGRTGVAMPLRQSDADMAPTIYHAGDGSEVIVDEIVRIVASELEVRPKVKLIEDGSLGSDEIQIVFPVSREEAHRIRPESRGGVRRD